MNHTLKRLHSSIGYIPPAEAEATYHNQLGKFADEAVLLQPNSRRETRGGSVRVSGFHRGPQQGFGCNQAGYTAAAHLVLNAGKASRKGRRSYTLQRKAPHSALKYRSPRVFRRPMDMLCPVLQGNASG